MIYKRDKNREIIPPKHTRRNSRDWDITIKSAQTGFFSPRRSLPPIFDSHSIDDIKRAERIIKHSMEVAQSKP